MTWVKLDDRFPLHRKLRRIPPSAGWLHVCALCWSASNLTDGAVPASELVDLSDLPAKEAERAAAELVRRGLWDAAGDGWKIHDFLEYQPSRSKVEAEREAARKRQRKRRGSGGVTP